ncbi:MAG: SDR family oxidoreductase [Oligoflexales bacterium]|nr:SDR family oxidoreductase [Oligoflexales bacterium]
MQANRMVIIGATSAIATELGRIYATKRWEIYLLARSPEKLKILEDDLKARGAVATHSRCFDFAHRGNYQGIVDWASQGGCIDLLLIAHGVLGDQKASEESNELALQDFEVNFLSYMCLLNSFSKNMESKKKGTIAVISSVAGDRGRQSNYFYGTAKGAITIFCEGLRNRLFKSNVHVLTVKPGFVKTPMTAHIKQGPLFVEPHKIAEDISRAVERKKNQVYTPWFWWIIMTIIKMIPEPILKRLKL